MVVLELFINLIKYLYQTQYFCSCEAVRTNCMGLNHYII